MSPETYTRIALAERPKANFDENTLRTETHLYSELKPDAEQSLVQVHLLSLDPAMRTWVGDARGYIPPIPVGDTMRAWGIATVLQTGADSKYKQNDLVMGYTGLTEYALMDDATTLPVNLVPGLSLEEYLGPLGVNGFTAYFGMYDIGPPKPGQTLVVTGAAGATGSIACQFGKLMGARVVAIAGTDEKCRWLKEELKCDVVLNYKSPKWREDFERDVGYFDVYFDNVGGEILDYMLSRVNQHGTIVCSGAMSEYYTLGSQCPEPKAIKNYINIVTQRVKLQGFIVTDYAERFPEAFKFIAAKLLDGSLKRRFHVIDGLLSAPDGIQMLFNGGNNGKLIVKVSEVKV